MGWMLFVSMSCGVMFSGSWEVMNLGAVLLLVLVAFYCWRNKYNAELSGAIFGFSVPLILAMLLVGEFFVPTVRGVYVETEANIPMAVFLVLVAGPVFAAVSSAIFSMMSLVFESKDR